MMDTTEDWPAVVDPAAGTQRDKCIQQLFEEQVVRTPDAVAVVFAGRSLTYGELNARANQLGYHLRSLGVGPEVLVGLCVERSLEMVVALLGILKAGGAYVPLDPAYPKERLDFMIGETSPAVLLTQAALVPCLPRADAPVFLLDADWPSLAGQATCNPASGVGPAHLAYVIFTSGSTGKPKAVLNEHRQLVNYVTGVIGRLALSPGWRYATVSTFAGDLGHTVVFPSLVTGGQLHVIPEALVSAPNDLADYFSSEAIGVLKIVPSHLRALLQAALPGKVAHLIPHRVLVLGGEALDWDLVARVRGVAPQCRIFNHYGPTETTVGVLVHDLQEPSPLPRPVTVPLGRPLPNSSIHIVDPDRRACGVGVPGEILIGGAGVARGYLNRREITEERFIADPFSTDPAARLYMSGDRGQWLPDGTIGFLGRMDHQVKIRGYRVEPGEIERRLADHASVEQAVVLACHSQSAERSLAAYLVVCGGTPPSAPELLRFLKEKLPEYMIPSGFVVVPAFPLTPNGKVDRLALESMEGVPLASEAGDAIPQGELEEQLVEIWRNELQLERLGVHENFYDLGGHSLQAIVICSQIARRLGVEVPVRWLFECPTIASLAERMGHQQGHLRSILPMEKWDRRAPLPMSPAQQGMWLLHQMLPDLSTYNQPVSCRLTGIVDRARCRQALRVIQARHEILRTALVQAEDGLVQQIAAVTDLALPWREVDLQGVPADRRQADLEDCLLEEVRRPFELDEAPLWRVVWIQLAPDDQVLACTFHHSVTDEWSKRLFFRELEQLYAAGGREEAAAVPELPVQYADYAAWQRQLLTGALFERQRAYWSGQLADLPPSLNLSAGRARPSGLDGRGAVHDFLLEGPVVTRLRELAREEEASLFMVMLAAFQVWLHRYSGKNDVVVGTPVALRGRPEVQSLLGFFMNTLPIRVRLEEASDFRQVLRQVRETLLEAFSHVDFPFEQMVGIAVKERAPGHQPLYQVMFVLVEDALPDLRLDDAAFRYLRVGTRTTKSDLTLRTVAVGGTWACQFEYAADLFSGETVRGMGQQLVELLNSITRDPGQAIQRLNLIPADGGAAMLHGWSGPQRDYPQDTCMHHLFEAQAGRTPEAVAVEFAGKSLTYAELNARADQLAGHLSSLGVGPEVLVGVCVERSLEMIVALFGILKAGGAYLPLDPAYPPERLQLIQKDSRAGIIVTRESLRPLFAEADPLCTLVLMETDLGAGPFPQPVPPQAPALAYVIYTSGSTGTPKGVAIEHRNAVNFLHWVRDAFSDEELAGVLAATSICFDISIFEIFGPLSWGGRIILTRDILDEMTGHDWAGVSLINTVPSLMETLLRTRAAPASLVTVNLAGEFARPGLIDAICREWNVPRVNDLYGPTETTIYSTWAIRRAGMPASIGRPIANTRAYILDAARKPVPHGGSGELYLGGAGVARGYLHQPRLTAERFIPDPFSADPEAGLYRTGDLVRGQADGNLEYLGRLDSQVKIRGFRIELGEIQVVLDGHPDLSACAVVAQHRVPGDQTLVAFVVGREQSVLPAASLRHWLQEKLPDYMIPARFVELPALPLTPNGKVDRKALEKMDGVELAAGTVYTPPRNDLERVIAEIWQALLCREQVGIRDNFFALGGHSLQVAIMCSQIKLRLGLALRVRSVFAHPTIESLAGWLASAEGQGDKPSSIARADLRQTLPMSLGQQGMWLLHQSLPDPAIYNEPVAWHLSGRVDRETIRRVLRVIMSRHGMLRTAPAQQGETLVQRITGADDMALPWREIVLPPHRQDEILNEQLLAEARQPFDLAEAPLWRVLWIQLGEERQVLAITFHHSIIDEWSQRLFFQEFGRLYAADGRSDRAGLPELPIDYADYAIWQRSAGDGFARQRQYWQEQLRDLPPVLELPADKARPLEWSGAGAVHHFSLSGAVAGKFRELAGSGKTTLFTVMLAAFQVWLHRYSGQSDIVVGTPIANRERPEIQSVIGFFLNTLPIRTRLDGNETFHEVLSQVRETLRGAFSHADLPFAEIVETTVRERGRGHSPIYQAMFVLLEEGLPDLDMAGVTARQLPSTTGTSKNDLTFSILAVGESWDCQLEYASDGFTAGCAERMAGHLVELLRSIAEAPEKPIRQLDLLPEAERQRMLVEWNRTERDYPRDRCVHQLFEEQADRTPEGVAAMMDGRRLTYRELNTRANQLARHLRTLGVGPDVPVGLCVVASFEMLVGVLAILKAGGAYLPLDPGLPRERLEFLLEGDEGGVVVTQQALRPLFTRASSRVLVMLDADTSAAGGAAGNPMSVSGPGDLAYVIYTSGSTGRPKGVEMPHRALVNLLHWQGSLPAGTASGRTLQFASLGFDVSFQELFSTWMSGGTLILIPDDVRKDPAALLETITYWEIDRIFLPFVMLEQLAAVAGEETPPPVHLKEVVVAGEQLRIGHGIRCFFGRLPGCRLWNQYGPSESHVVTGQMMTGAPGLWPDLPPIGRPVANCRIYLLDARLEPVPPGMAGDLYIGGECLARGYRRRPDLTAERFIPDPFRSDPASRLYNTGDLARYLPDGTIEFLGRKDHQVKIRGHRVEPGEVEAVLGELSGVTACAVATLKDGGGDNALVAFVVGGTPAGLAVESLRQGLGEKLPDYMIPSRFAVIPALPLTPSGKVDRKALEKMDGVELDPASEYTPPGNDLERVIAEIWQTVLRRERVGIRDDFFGLGGHSLQAAIMCSQIKLRLGMAVSLRSVFEYPTIESLAKRMGSAAGQEQKLPPVRKADRRQALPMSFGQQGMWLLHQTLPDPASYNQSVAWRLSGPVDKEKLRRVLGVIMERHEVLRTALEQQQENLVQRIVPAAGLAPPWQEMDLQSTSPELREGILQERMLAAARQPFDLAEAPLWRVLWYQLGGEEQVLALSFHHSIIDEWSLRLFFHELERLYTADGRMERAGLPELPVQYADYAEWQRQRLGGDSSAPLRDYWQQQLKDPPPVLELPADKLRPLHRSGGGAALTFRLSAVAAAKFRALARQEATTLFTVMLTAFQVWLYRCSGQQDLVVGTPVANRERPETQSLIGFFLNSVPIRTRLQENDSFLDVLRRVRETTLGALSHAELPFEQLVELTVKERVQGSSPIYQVMFVLLEEGLPSLRLGEARIRPAPMTSRTSKNDLVFSIQAADQEWECRLEYATDLFTAEGAAGMARHLEELLGAIPENPRSPISRLNLLPEAERRQVVVEWNRTAADYPRDQCVHHLFQEQAQLTPEAVAMVMAGDTLTYARLDALSDHLAGHLRTCGVESGDLVALRMERSFDLIIGILGILKAGGAYWALEDHLPEERLRRMLAAARPRLLLTRDASVTELTGLLPDDSTEPTVAIAGIEHLLASPAAETAPPPRPARSTDPVYLNYTSGSTGEPKGVLVAHRGVVRLVRGADYVQLTARDTLLQLSPLSFDASTFELWGGLLNGGRVVLMPSGPAAPGDIAEAIRRHGVTTLWLTAGLFHLMVDECLEGLRPLRHLLAGGDVLSPDHVRRAVRALPGCRIINGYGPTENTTFTCCYPVEDAGSVVSAVPIGRPIANTRVYVLDPFLQPVPVGVAGELYAGGDGVALGYLHQPGLTAERFIPDPFSDDPEARLYWTGDRVRWRPDGNLEFLGRLDHQIKIRGYRVEPGEIEAILRAQPEVREVAVIAREDLSGDKQLVAYFVSQPGENADPSALRATLSARLPDYLIPAAFVGLDRLPLKPNGKLDLKALPAPERNASGPAPGETQPLNLLELELTRIWRRLFRREEIGRQDNFFELGGHSLLAAQLAVRVQTLVGRRVPISAFFQAPTIASLAAMLKRENWTPRWNVGRGKPQRAGPDPGNDARP